MKKVLTNEMKATLKTTVENNSKPLSFWDRLVNLFNGKLITLDSLNNIHKTYHKLLDTISDNLTMLERDHNAEQLLHTQLHEKYNILHINYDDAMRDITKEITEREMLQVDYNNLKKSHDIIKSNNLSLVSDYKNLEKQLTKAKLEINELNARKNNKVKTCGRSLTCKQITDAEKAIASGAKSMTTAAKFLGVAYTTLSRAIKGTTYKECYKKRHPKVKVVKPKITKAKTTKPKIKKKEIAY